MVGHVLGHGGAERDRSHLVPAVISLLASTVPASLQVLDPASDLPILPTFSISLYLRGRVPRSRLGNLRTTCARVCRRHAAGGLTPLLPSGRHGPRCEFGATHWAIVSSISENSQSRKARTFGRVSCPLRQTKW